MTVKIDDKAFQADFRRALNEIDSRGRTQIRGRADRIAARAQEIVHVRSGLTREEIHVVQVKDDTGKPAFEVRSDAPESIFEEFGTSLMEAIPFLRPAFAEEQ